jgi:flagellar basal-body rod protein FlgG
MPPSITQILHLSRSAMLARLQDLDNVSNNLANVNTTGYKSSRLNFQEILDQARYGGVRLRATQRFMRQGTIQEEADPFILAINGEGFFALQLSGDRTAYTRDGHFTLDADRRLVSTSGYPVVWDGEIPEDAVNFHVNPDGTVMVQQGNVWNEAGQIPLTRFPNPLGLESYGQNLWLETEVSGEAAEGTAGAEGYGQIIGNASEASNVNLSGEMTQLISLERAFQMSTRTFQATEEMLAQAIQMRR